jgi:hypothetical protein
MQHTSEAGFTIVDTLAPSKPPAPPFPPLVRAIGIIVLFTRPLDARIITIAGPESRSQEMPAGPGAPVLRNGATVRGRNPIPSTESAQHAGPVSVT